MTDTDPDWYARYRREVEFGHCLKTELRIDRDSRQIEQLYQDSREDRP